MDSKTHKFESLKPRLLGIAYRILGSRAEAEDVAQDAYLRWHQIDTEPLRSAEAWLVTTVTRLSTDRTTRLLGRRPAHWQAKTSGTSFPYGADHRSRRNAADHDELPVSPS